VRIRSVLVAVLALGLLAFGAWAAIGPRTGGLPNTNNVHSVDVEFWPWGEDGVMAPGGSSSDPEAVAALVAVIRSAEETRDHKCGSRGVITLRRSLWRSERLEFLPGHHAEWYEFRYGGKIYRVPRAEFVAAMRKIGVEVPLECC
jgi:hypothetical protein